MEASFSGKDMRQLYWELMEREEEKTEEREVWLVGQEER